MTTEDTGGLKINELMPRVLSRLPRAIGEPLLEAWKAHCAWVHEAMTRERRIRRACAEHADYLAQIMEIVGDAAKLTATDDTAKVISMSVEKARAVFKRDDDGRILWKHSDGTYDAVDGGG